MSETPNDQTDATPDEVNEVYDPPPGTVSDPYEGADEVIQDPEAVDDSDPTNEVPEASGVGVEQPVAPEEVQ